AAYVFQRFTGPDVDLSVDGNGPVDRVEQVDLDRDDLAAFEKLGEVPFEQRRGHSAAVGGDGQLNVVIADVLAGIGVEHLGLGDAGVALGEGLVILQGDGLPETAQLRR